jgi:hypothetical protein
MLEGSFLSKIQLRKKKEEEQQHLSLMGAI